MPCIVKQKPRNNNFNLHFHFPFGFEAKKKKHNSVCFFSLCVSPYKKVYLGKTKVVLYVVSKKPYFSSFQRLKDAIVQDYQTTKTNQYKRYREEFQYLHNKLEHIKKLVSDFDTRSANPSSSGRNSSMTSSSSTSEFSSRLSPLAASS